MRTALLAAVAVVVLAALALTPAPRARLPRPPTPWLEGERGAAEEGRTMKVTRLLQRSIAPMLYPAARRSNETYRLHGKVIPEPYNWLEDPESAETKDFVEKQNAAFEEFMAPVKDLREKIFERMMATQNYARTSAPSFRGGKYYFYHNTGLQRQDVYMEADSLAPDATPSVFLDINTLSSDGTSSLRTAAWSEDEKVFAYGVSDKGSDWQHIKCMDAATKQNLPDLVKWVKFSGISWWNSNGFFYTRYPALGDDVDLGAETDSAENPEICYHVLGTPQEEDIHILRVPENPTWTLNAEVSDCGSYLVVTLFDGCEPFNLLWVAKLPAGGPSCLKEHPLVFDKVINDFTAAYGYLGNDESVFYLTTSKDAPNKKIISLDIATKDEKDVIPQRPSVMDHVVLVKDTLFVTYLEDVKSVLYYAALHGSGGLKQLPTPLGSISTLHGRRKSDFVSFHITSFVIPGRSYTLNVKDPEGSLAIFRDSEVVGLLPDDYVVEQKRYNSADGTSIPMFIIHHKATTIGAHTPVLLYGYGGFDISISPGFSPLRLVFLNHLRGVYAIANIRGGGEYGRSWHDNGRKQHKQNCFTDFIWAAKFLHKESYGSPSTTAIMGGSNGGLLVAAVANQAPELLRSVVCQVGVLDMYKFHKFTIGHAWKSDYGNPDEKDDFEVLEKYSPLHNIRTDTDYPSILVVTGDHDDRVVPMHSLKYVAALQHANPSRGGPFLARIEKSTGHGAGKPTDKRVREAADMYTFVAHTCGSTWHD